MGGWKRDAYANSGGLWTQSHAVNDEAAPKIESRRNPITIVIQGFRYRGSFFLFFFFPSNFLSLRRFASSRPPFVRHEEWGEKNHCALDREILFLIGRVQRTRNNRKKIKKKRKKKRKEKKIRDYHVNKKIRRSFSFLFFRQQTLYFRHRNSRLQNLSNPIISFLHLFYKTLFHIRRRFIQNDLIRLFLRNSFFFFFFPF